MVDVFRLPLDRFAEAGAFAAALNTRPEHHIGYLPEDADAATKALRELEPSPEYVFATESSNALTGLIALEYDEPLARAWVWGPWCVGDDWESRASALYAAAAAAAPQSLHLFELWFDSRNLRVRALAEGLGFTLYKRAFPYGFGRDGLASIPPADFGEAAPGYRDSLIALHESCFPGTYYSGTQILEKHAEPGSKYRLLAAGEGGVCHGYIFLEVDPEVGEAHIHFLGVSDAHRRQGLGRRLLFAGMHWLFSHDGIDHLGLLVEPDNPAAIRLYESAGWTRERETEAWRRRTRE